MANLVNKIGLINNNSIIVDMKFSFYNQVANEGILCPHLANRQNIYVCTTHLLFREYVSVKYTQGKFLVAAL